MEPDKLWSMGDYRVVGELWADAGRGLVESLDVHDRDVVDLATGTGVAAIAAAERGARSVTGVDVTPVLLAEAARRSRRVMADYFPDAPTPWHETPETITATVGDDTSVTERTFALTINSPEAFIDVLEQHSAPFVLAAENLGERWPHARERLRDAETTAARPDGATCRIDVPYLVTTIPVGQAPS